MCHAAMTLFSASFGLYSIQRVSLLLYMTPPSAITLGAPWARIEFTSVCIPAAWKETPGQVPPSRQHCQAATVSWFESGKGSLCGSKITASLPAYAVATCDQKVGEWSMSGIGCCPLAFWLPGADQC